MNQSNSVISIASFLMRNARPQQNFDYSSTAWGWIENASGQHARPSTNLVRFENGQFVNVAPVSNRFVKARRWFARLMGVSA